jgi:hypothetical protein
MFVASNATSTIVAFVLIRVWPFAPLISIYYCLSHAPWKEAFRAW